VRRITKLKYEQVDTRSLKGLKRAEYLKAHGWRIISTGLWLIHFEKREVTK
jgi:hypothetical protein